MSAQDLMKRIRKGSFAIFVGFLSFSALLAIVTVLFGEFGSLELRVLLTTSIIAIISICALCCSAYSARSGNGVPGAIGITLALLSGGLWILAIWAELENDSYFKMSATLSFFAIGTAHALALLAVRVREKHRWVQLASTVLIYALTSLLAMMVWLESEAEGLIKLLVVLAILVALESLVVPILGRGGGGTPAPGHRLILEAQPDGTYLDARGNLYQVKPLSPSDSVP